jgi:hypothetical protein
MKRRRHTPEQILRKLREAGPEGVGAGNLVRPPRRLGADYQFDQTTDGRIRSCSMWSMSTPLESFGSRLRLEPG